MDLLGTQIQAAHNETAKVIPDPAKRRGSQTARHRYNESAIFGLERSSVGLTEPAVPRTFRAWLQNRLRRKSGRGLLVLMFTSCFRGKEKERSRASWAGRLRDANRRNKKLNNPLAPWTRLFRIQKPALFEATQEDPGFAFYMFGVYSPHDKFEIYATSWHLSSRDFFWQSIVPANNVNA